MVRGFSYTHRSATSVDYSSTLKGSMAVYVDNARIPYRRMIMNHMIADTLDELHAMADAIGMKREWFQPTSFPHYDVCLMRKAKAVELGAIDVPTQRRFALIMRAIKSNPIIPLERNTQ
jgi:hypothetical protein